MKSVGRGIKSQLNSSAARDGLPAPHGLQAPRLELVTSATRPGKVARPFAGDPFMVSSPTRAETASAVRVRVGRLIEFVRDGRILDAIGEFYADDVELGRGALAPMFGFETRAGRRWIHAHADAEWRSFRVRGVGVNGDTSFIESSLDFLSGSECSSNRERFTQHQVAVAQWREGKIVKECLIPRLPLLPRR
jgi:hypothetical protein